MPRAPDEIGFIAVDGIAELQRLSEISRNRHTATVMLRLNVGVEASTHAFVRTGGKDSKFGIHPRDESAAAIAAPGQSATALRRRTRSYRLANLRRVGLFGKRDGPRRGGAAVCKLRAAKPTRIVIGGGFGVPSDPDGDNERLDVAATVAAAARCVRGAAQERGLGTVRGRDRTRTCNRRRRRHDALSRAGRQAPVASHLRSRRRRHRGKPAPGALRRALPR